ncbi:hypothetical protein V8E54_011105 [Elaphomyces granulatus]
MDRIGFEILTSIRPRYTFNANRLRFYCRHTHIFLPPPYNGKITDRWNILSMPFAKLLSRQTALRELRSLLWRQLCFSFVPYRRNCLCGSRRLNTILYDIGKRQNPGRMTEMELLGLCEKAIDQDLHGPTPISNTTNSTPKRNMPPKGTKAFKWVEQWLQGNQRNSQNKCSFCETGLHDYKDCWYLVPEIRPPSWTPYNGLWCYKAFNRNQLSPSQLSQARNTSPLSAPRSETSEPQNQSKMTVEFTRDEEPYDMQIIPSFMSMASLPTTEPASNRNAHFDPKDIHPGDFPTYRPWLSDTATNYFICSERTAIFEY